MIPAPVTILRPRTSDASAQAMADLERARSGLAGFISRLTERGSPVAAEVLATACDEDWFGCIDRAQDALMRTR